MERYPAFVSMVLNNVSDVTSTFLCPLRCLQKLLEVLGEALLSLGTSISVWIEVVDKHAYSM